MQNYRMWIERKISSSVARLGESFPAVLITGPRQVGKTSLLRHLFPQASYLSFDVPSLARQAEENPQDLFATLSEPILFDEIQYAPSLFRELKVRIDADRRAGRFFLTGSQTFPLMQGVSESLAGRCGIVEMNSLSYSELRSSFPEISERRYLVEGGFPELYSGNIQKPFDWYSSYLATYLERDVRNLKNVGDLRDFERLLRAAALRAGQLLSYSELARDVGVSPNTAKQWISVLESSGQIYLLEPYHRSLGKRLIKSPKLYFMDTGLASYLVGIRDWEDLQRSPLAGAFWENHVLAQIIRYYRDRAETPPLWFWRTGYGDEVDFLIERGGRFIAIECKLNELPGASSLKGFAALQGFYGEGVIEKGLVACRSSHPFQYKEGNYWAVPGSEIENYLAR